MRRDLELTLFKTYPKIFPPNDWREYDPKKRNSLECGDGWFHLINYLCKKIQAYVDNKKVPQTEAILIKEKFGQLRFHVTNQNPSIERLINRAYIVSGKVCEQCGSMDNVTQTKGCIMTICKVCHKIYEAENVED